MTKNGLLRAALVAALLGASSAPAYAQDLPAAEVAGGWNFISVSQAGFDTETAPAGWFAEVSGNVNRLWSVVGTVGGNYKTIFGETLKVHAMLGGVRLSRRGSSSAVPFAQVLYGAGSFSGGGFSGTHSGLDIGGGVNVRVRPGVAIRAGADYLRVFSKGETEHDTLENVNVFRLTVGVAVPLGLR